MSKQHYHAGYLRTAFNQKQRAKFVKNVRAFLKGKSRYYDGFAVTGVSGIAMGAVLAHLLGKDLVIVRKNNADCHSRVSVENFALGQRLIFLDDLIASGDTFSRVNTAILKMTDHVHMTDAKALGSAPKIVGKILYYEGKFNIEINGKQVDNW